VARSPLKRTTTRTALVLIDLVNAFEYPGGAAMLRATRKIVPAVSRLAHRAREARVPVVYANDNFARWRSDFRELVERLVAPEHPARPVVQPLVPAADDYFVLKPRHSAFYATPLELLHSLGVERVVLAGISAESCVLITACDAHVRGFAVHVPADCVASARSRDAHDALKLVASSAGADTAPASAVRWSGVGPSRRRVLGRSLG
jgi:nicotinamidase-related amidase